jgi:putative transposase
LTVAVVGANRGEWPVCRRWEALEVSAIAATHAEVKGRYGSPRMTAEWNARGDPCAENTVAKLMRIHHIRAKAPRRFVRTTDSRHDLPVFANRLDRDFEPGGPNASWCADLTHLPTAAGWRYLAVVEDLFRRRIVGWSRDETMTSRLVVDALRMA